VQPSENAGGSFHGPISVGSWIGGGLSMTGSSIPVSKCER
jgi:hypothetical protein